MNHTPSFLAAAKQLAHFIAPYRVRLMLSLLCAALFGLSAAAPTYLLKHVVDDLFIKQHEYLIVPMVGAYILLFALKGVFMYLTSYLMHWVNNHVSNDIRKTLFQALLNKPNEFFASHTTGQLMSHFLNDVAMVQQAASSAIRDGIRSFFEAMGLIGFAFYQSWKLGFSMLVVAPVLGALVRNVGRARKKASLRIQEQNKQLANALQESFVGIRAIKAFNAQTIETERFGHKLGSFFDAVMYNTKIESLAPASVEVIAAIGCSVVFYIAACQVLAGTLTGGQLTSFVAAVLLAYQPLKKIINVYADCQYGLAAAHTIFQVINEKPADHDKRVHTLARFNNEIVFDNVSVGYQADNPILRNINLVLRKGQRIGIVGPSGTGKSTLCDLLLGFLRPMSGRVSLDGQDITTLTYKSLRDHIGYVSQTTFLFNDSVANNVAYAQQHATQKQIIAACKAAHADEFIQDMEQGYQTMVGENGTRLSGGQKQRITIARALLKNPEILIFDEPTSALDEESENMICKAITDLGPDKTVLIVSHRPGLLAHLDQLLVVDRGTVTSINPKTDTVYQNPSSVAAL